jgi:hypothetical protein
MANANLLRYFVCREHDTTFTPESNCPMNEVRRLSVAPNNNRNPLQRHGKATTLFSPLTNGK